MDSVKKPGIAPVGGLEVSLPGGRDLESRGSFKTTLCRFYSTPNGCMRGEMCTFAHGVAQLRETERERVY
jgi:hypothetical protein